MVMTGLPVSPLLAGMPQSVHLGPSFVLLEHKSIEYISARFADSNSSGWLGILLGLTVGTDDAS
jgi:hypothetical protein